MMVEMAKMVEMVETVNAKAQTVYNPLLLPIMEDNQDPLLHLEAVAEMRPQEMEAQPMHPQKDLVMLQEMDIVKELTMEVLMVSILLLQTEYLQEKVSLKM
jgi:hypothetical protein